MTVREPLPAPDRSRRPGPKGKVGERPDPLPGPPDAVPARAAALSGEAGRRCQPSRGRCSTWSRRSGWSCARAFSLGYERPSGPGRPRSPPGRLPGVPPVLVAGGECPGLRCRHIRGLGRAEPGRAGAAASSPAAGRGSGVGGRRGGAGLGRRSPGSEEDFPGVRCWPGGG